MSKRISFFLSALIILFANNAFAQRWDFTSSTEGWTGRNATVSQGCSPICSLYAVTSVTTSDPGVVSPSNLNLQASTNNSINLSLASNWADTQGYIYFSTVSSPNMANNTPVPFYVINNGAYNIYHVDMTYSPQWAGTISQIRIDPANNGILNKSVGFDYIETVPKVITPVLSVSKTTMNVGDTIHLTCDLTSAGAGRLLAFFIKNGETTVASDQETANSSGVATFTPDPIAQSNWQPSVSIQCRDESTMTTSAWQNVTVASPLPPPTLTSPISGQIVYVATNPGPVPLRWGEVTGNAGYKLEIDILPIMDISSNQYDATLGVSSHTWRVCTKNSAGICGAWSTVETFTVQQSTQPSPPTLISPSGNVPSDTDITFLWNTSPGAARYRLKICTDMAMSTCISGSPFDAPLGQTWYTVPASYFTVGTAYYWQVGAIAPGDVGGWGNYGPTLPWSITVVQMSPNPVFVPLFRGYSRTDTDHFYTTSQVERDNLPSHGYNYEKIEAYISDRPFPEGVSLYRLYHPTGKSHYYTTKPDEKQNAINLGFIDEGTIGYVYPDPWEFTVPMYHLYHELNKDHFYTISEFERDNAVQKFGYQDKGIAMYVSRNGARAPLAGKPTAKQSGIDMASGNFQPYYNHIDFANPPGKGIPFVFTRTFNAMNEGDSGPLGPGWNHGYNIRVVEDTTNGIAIMKWSDGRDDYYTINGTTYVPYPGIYDTLIKSGSTFILTKKDMTKYTFEEYSPGLVRLTRIEDRNGNPLVLQYDTTPNLDEGGNLVEVEDGSGRHYYFTYNVLPEGITDSNRYRLRKITEQNMTPMRSIRFGYDAKGNLIQYYDAENNLTQYEYDEDNLLTKIMLPRGNTWKAVYENNKTGRITGYTIGKEISGQTPIVFQTANINYGQTDGTVITVAANPVTGFPGKRDSCNHLPIFAVSSCKDGANSLPTAFTT